MPVTRRVEFEPCVPTDTQFALVLTRVRHLDPPILITHDLPLDEGVRDENMLKKWTDGGIRVALQASPGQPRSTTGNIVHNSPTTYPLTANR